MGHAMTDAGFGLAGADVQHTVAQLLTAFGSHADNHDPQALCDLFLPDARLVLNGLVCEGQAALRADFVQRVGNRARKTRHLWSNLQVLEAGAHSLHTACIQQTFDLEEGHASAKLRINDLRDTFRRDAQGLWKFAERRITRQFALQLPLERH